MGESVMLFCRHLKLEHNRIRQLTPAICQCVSLQQLSMTGNPLEEIPWKMIRLRELHNFTFDVAPLSRAFPPDILEQGRLGLFSLLSAFTESQKSGKLWLSKRGLKDIHPSLSSIICGLQVLDLSANAIESVSESSLHYGTPFETSLKVLDLRRNKLTRLASGIGKATSLQVLMLQHNLLTRLPVTIALLTNLECLEVDDSKMEFPPPHICAQGAEVVVRFLSHFIDALSTHELVLDGYELHSLPVEVTHIPSLTKISLCNNIFSDLTQPFKMLRDVPALRSINLEENRVSVLPDLLMSLSGIHELLLQNNPLSRLPVWIDEMAVLESISFGGPNVKADWIHGSLCQMDLLVRLQIHDVGLKSFDVRYMYLPLLESLSLKNNKLTCFPCVLMEYRRLEFLCLQLNLIDRISDEEIMALRNLQHLDVSGNPLAFLPVGLGALRELKLVEFDADLVDGPPQSINDAGMESVLQFYRDLVQSWETGRLKISNRRLLDVPIEVRLLGTSLCRPYTIAHFKMG